MDMRSARSVRSLAAVFVFLFGCSAVHAQQKTLDRIKRISDDVGKRIELSESGAEESQFAEIVCNELVVNKNSRVWPAVGNYQVTYKFYYDFAGTEDRHYPDRLRKVVLKSSMSDRSYYEEYLFDDSGALIFYYSKPSEPPIGDEKPPPEQRVYFSGRRPIRIVRGASTSDRMTAADVAFGRKIISTSRQIAEFFVRSLALPNE